MPPITFSCREPIARPPRVITEQILDLASWITFTGYGPLPGITSATFDRQASGIVGTRIRVVNTDGSSHVEEIVEWDPDRRVRLVLSDFSRPLARLATHFVETWDFELIKEGTMAARSFELHPKSAWARPVLWLIARLLRRAVARHLRQMKEAAAG